MEFNIRTVLIGLLYNLLGIHISGALFFGTSNTNNYRVGTNKRYFEKSLIPFSFHYPERNILISEQVSSVAKPKRFFEYNQVAFGKKYGGRNTKRFFHFSPFINFNNDRKTWRPKVKPKPQHREMLVDHFTGVLPSSLHTSNKKYTHEEPKISEFRQSVDSSFEGNGFKLDTNNHPRSDAFNNHFINDKSSIHQTFIKDKPPVLNSQERHDIIQATTPTSVDATFETLPFEWLNGKLTENNNRHATKISNKNAKDTYQNSNIKANELDNESDFEKYSLNWLNNKLSLPNNVQLDDNLEFKTDPKQSGDADFIFLNSASSPYDQSNNDNFEQFNDQFQQQAYPDLHQLGFGTIELRNHDRIHSGFDTLDRSDSIPQPSEFVIPSYTETQFIDSDGHLSDALLEKVGDYGSWTDYNTDDLIPELISETKDKGSFSKEDDLIQPHIGRGSFLSDNNHCEDIDTRICDSDMDCSCYGLYTCKDMRCVSFEAILSESYQPAYDPAEVPDDNGQWFDTPFDDWTK